MSTCASCQYFVPEGEGSTGACRRYPQPVKRQAGYWCGEHKRRYVAKEQAHGVQRAVQK